MSVTKSLIGTTAALGAAAILATAALAEAHVSPEVEQAVNARQSHMSLLAFNIGPLGAMARGNMEYDAQVATQSAENLAMIAALHQANYWVEGSDSESVEGSRALPAIWEDMAGFEAEVEDLMTSTAALAESAGDGLEAMQAAMGGVGQSCGSCHRAYRAESN